MGRARNYFAQRRKSGIIADALAIAHFVVANIVMTIGQTTSLFDFGGWNFPGVRFIYEYLDYPMYIFLKPHLAPIKASNPFPTYLYAEVVIISSSVFYGIIAFIICEALFSILEMGR